MAYNFDTQKFALDPNQALGLDYQMYLSSIRALSISKPAQYYSLRRVVLEKVKKEAVSGLYKSFFNILVGGVDQAGNPIGDATNKLGAGEFIPNYPAQKVNDIDIEVAGILCEELNKVIDLILPDDLTTIMDKKMSIKGMGERVD
jgi:hypothetical protein